MAEHGAEEYRQTEKAGSNRSTEKTVYRETSWSAGLTKYP
jgi:hypothetical protein